MLIAQSLADAVRRADLPATFRADERLRALAARRRQLVDARQAEGCRADLASDPIVRESLATIVAALTQSLDAIEAAIERHIASDGELDRLAKALRAVRGVERPSSRKRSGSPWLRVGMVFVPTLRCGVARKASSQPARCQCA